MSEVWSICPIQNTEAIVTIKDENGLEVGTCIAEDAPMIVLAPKLQTDGVCADGCGR